MSTPIVKFKKLNFDARLPTRGTPGAACLDLYSSEPVKFFIDTPRRVVPTGIAVELPPGYVGLVCSRSGLAANNYIFVLNAPGVIDEDYRGEIKVILYRAPDNHNWPSTKVFELPAGSRIAQLMIVPVPQLMVEETVEFSTETLRGLGGFGSTGV